MLLIFTVLLSLFVPSSETAKLAYRDEFARETMFPLAAAAYSDSPQDCFKSLGVNYTMVQEVLVSCSPDDDSTCFGYVAVSHERSAIILAFRGTMGIHQIEDEVWDIAQEPRVPFVAGGNVAEYFSDVFSALWTGGIKDALRSAVRDHPSYQVWITGHSLGAAIGSLTALYISKTKVVQPESIVLVTFGQPRVGDRAFADAADNLVPNAYRIIHAQDVVPHFPPSFLGYLHHMTEVFYDNDMESRTSFVICEGNEDPLCSNLYLLSTSLEDHQWYFGKQVSRYGKNKCVSNDDNTQFVVKHPTAI